MVHIKPSHSLRVASSDRSAKPSRLIEGPQAKARSMSAQGYRLEPMDAPYCFRVTRPQEAPIQDVTGDTVTGYHVCIHPSSASCDCAWFGIHGERFACKHIEFARLFLEGAMRLLSPVADLCDVLTELGIEPTDASKPYLNASSLPLTTTTLHQEPRNV